MPSLYNRKITKSKKVSSQDGSINVKVGSTSRVYMAKDRNSGNDKEFFP